MKTTPQNSATEELRSCGDDEFQRAITLLVTEVENLPRPEVPAAERRFALRHWHGLAALAAAAALAGVFVLVEWDSVVLRATLDGDLPAPPAAVLAAFDQNPCAQRMGRIMNALSAYSARHGAPPDSLDRLTPGFLSEPAVDPFSGEPYGYERKGETAILACPHPERHTGGPPPS